MSDIKDQKIKKCPSPRLVRLGRKMSKPGFSLIEVLVALFVLSIGISAVFLLMSKNLRSSMDARDQIIASQLAQEGIELVRNLKDTEKLDTYESADGNCDWTKKVDTNDCDNLIINEAEDGEISLEEANNDEMQLHLDDKNYYVHDSGTETKFFRRIDLEIEGDIGTDPAVPSTRIITVTSYVTWNGSGFGSFADLSTDCKVGKKCVSVVAVFPDYK